MYMKGLFMCFACEADGVWMMRMHAGILLQGRDVEEDGGWRKMVSLGKDRS